MKTLTIGSSGIDLFLAPKKQTSYVQNERTVSFNLGDKIPVNVNGLTLGGNGANVSVGMSRLGLEASFYTYLGTDILSTYIKEGMKKEKIGLVEDKSEKEKTSLSLIFDFTDDRIIFSHHEYRQHTIDDTLLAGYDAIYLTSIGKEWVGAYETIINYVHAHPTALAFSPGSPQLADLQDVVYEIIAASKILFCNKQEGERILEKKGEKAADMKELLQKLSALGPQIVSVTDGKDGAYAMTDGQCFVAPSFNENQESIDKTGAGDSYACAFFSAIILGNDIKTAMRWGSVNAHSVMGQIGAQTGLETQEQIQTALQARPDFQVEML